MSDKAGERPKKVIHCSPTQSWAPFYLAKPPANPVTIPLRQTRVVPLDPPRNLSDEELTWLRIGLGFRGTDHRWMFRLSADNQLRLTRAWTGREIYRATIRYVEAGPAVTDVQVDADDQSDDAQVAERFRRTLDHVLGLRHRLEGVPATPEEAWALTAPDNAPRPADLVLLAAALRSQIPFRVRRMRVGDETAHIDAELVEAIADGEAVLLLFSDGGRIAISQPWRWSMTDNELGVVNGDAVVWPGPTWGLDPNLATWVAWNQTIGIGSRKLDWSGEELAPVDNFEPGMPDLILDLTGESVARAGGPAGGRRGLQHSTDQTTVPVPEQWTDEERQTLDRLILSDQSWTRFRDRPMPGLGHRGLRLAAEVLERGGRVIPAAPEEFGDLHIELADRQILAFLNDYGDPSDAVWARLIETIGPFPETPATDRALADFSIHGPFERNVTRRSGQVWVEIRVRLADVATAFLDLDNVAMILAQALTEAARGTHGQR